MTDYPLEEIQWRQKSRIGGLKNEIVTQVTVIALQMVIERKLKFFISWIPVGLSDMEEI